MGCIRSEATPPLWATVARSPGLGWAPTSKTFAAPGLCRELQKEQVFIHLPCLPFCGTPGNRMKKRRPRFLRFLRSTGLF